MARISDAALEKVVGGEAYIYGTVPLTLRMNWDLLSSNNPPKSVVRRWRAEADIQRRKRPRGASPDEEAQMIYEDVLLEMPRGKLAKRGGDKGIRSSAMAGEDWDPLKLIYALSFAVFLKQSREFTEAVDAADVYRTGELPPEPRPPSLDPTDRTIRRSKTRLDFVGCLLERREIHALLAANMIRSVTINTDGSPVSGAELQGCILDIILHTSELKRIVLPGASLTYNHYDAVSKTIALVHGVWLVAGPDEETIRAIFGLVKSIATDQGTEAHTLECPDLVSAYCAFMDGLPLEDCRSLVRFDRRLLPAALRVAGWSHGFGNVMRSVAKACPIWPQSLDAMRALTAFWRTDSWRSYVQFAGQGRGINTDVLNSFTAGFANLAVRSDRRGNATTRQSASLRPRHRETGALR